MKKLYVLLFIPIQLAARQFSPEEVNRWEAQASQVTIFRDNWGIPHVYGKTDADAVFGLLYAQCEDDFPRVEMNYIEKLGRTSEVYGEQQLYNDLYLRMVIDSTEAMKDFASAPGWLQQLMQAFADGINYYLYKHPEVKPALLHRFQPWYPLLWTDGSIGAISTGDITPADVQNLYSGSKIPTTALSKAHSETLSGSNGFAIAPSRTASGNTILYINPHVTFYFRPEVHMVSEEGLNVYGAVTWGQFFIYQGFNEHCGWMHTSSSVDVADMYAEQIVSTANGMVYTYDNATRPVQKQTISLRYAANGTSAAKTFTIWSTHHGPVMAYRDGRYISVKANNRSMDGLIQSWQRTKAKGFDDFKQIMELRANTSNNTVFADDKGNIAYWHGNFVPVRDTQFNWGKVVDGTTTATEWKGLHQLDDIVHVYNPASGWIQNCNSTPFTVSGESSPKAANFPAYMAPDGENFRGVNAVRVLKDETRFTIDKVIAAGYDNYLALFEVLVPALITAFEKNIPLSDTLYARLAGPVNTLKNWDYRCNTQSIATTLAIEWGERLSRDIRRVYIEEGESDQVEVTQQFAAKAKPQELIQPLLATVQHLEQKFGTWQVAWGDINRIQRINNNLELSFDDRKNSYPVAFASSLWGMLPSYNSRYFPGTIKRYGYGGNSFVCAVEFGKKITAKSLLAGGNSGNPASPHFNDQVEMYSKGQFKTVLFYKEDIVKHAERSYHPGN